MTNKQTNKQTKPCYFQGKRSATLMTDFIKQLSQQTLLNNTTQHDTTWHDTTPHNTNDNILQSAFFKDCFFLEGSEMTLMMRYIT